MNLRQRAEKLKTELPAVLLALKHPDTPVIAKVLAALTMGYALSPVDLIPDFVPVLGYLDDLVLLPMLVGLTVRCIPEPVMEECRRQAEILRQGTEPKHWYYAIPIVLIWVAVVAGLLRRILR